MFLSQKETRTALGRALGLDFLCVGEHIQKNKDLEVIDFWFAGISYFHRPQQILVAAVNTRTTKTGILVVPSVEMSDPFLLVDLSRWDDPVLERLHHIDLAPRGTALIAPEAKIYDFDLTVETFYSVTTFAREGYARNPDADRLWVALLETVFTIAERSNQRVLHDYLDGQQEYTQYKTQKRQQQNATRSQLLFKSENSRTEARKGTPMGLQLYMVGVIVEDMARAVEFYRRLGVDVPEGSESKGHVEVKMGEMTFFLTTKAINARWDPARSDGSGGYRIILEFYLVTREAVDAKYNEMIGYGYESHVAPYVTPFKTYFAMINDPDGNTILLSAFLE